MKIIRFFLSNFILISFFCAIIYAYYYWDNLTGEDTPVGQAVAYLSKEYKSVSAFIEGIKSKQSGEERVSSEIRATDNSVDDDVVSVAHTEQNAVSNNKELVKTEVYITPEVEQALDQALNRQASKQSVISTTDTKSQDKKHTEKETNRAIWIDARKAFYKRDYMLSISSYRQVIANTTDNYDAYGELGNVYFNQGKKTEAAAAYYEAASLLVKLGHSRRADSLLPLLKYLDSEKAAELKDLLVSNQL